jgi:hypothetical protein
VSETEGTGPSSFFSKIKKDINKDAEKCKQSLMDKGFSFFVLLYFSKSEKKGKNIVDLPHVTLRENRPRKDNEKVHPRRQHQDRPKSTRIHHWPWRLVDSGRSCENNKRLNARTRPGPTEPGRQAGASERPDTRISTPDARGDALLAGRRVFAGRAAAIELEGRGYDVNTRIVARRRGGPATWPHWDEVTTPPGHQP